MAKLVSKVYGDALFEVAVESKEVDLLYEEVKALRAIWQENPGLAQLLNNPKIAKEEKMGIIRKIFDGRIEGELMGLLATAVIKNRQNEIPAICDYFISAVKEYKKIGVAFVLSAARLKEDQKAKVLEKLLATTGYLEFELHFEVDPELIGGMVIRIGDRVVDSSVKTQLYELKRELLKLQLA